MHIVKHFKKTTALLVAMFCVLLFGAESCDETETPAAQATENKTRQGNYETLVKNQPAHTMNYSPTRDTKNFWIDTWGTKGKVSYVYLLSNGTPYAFAVLKRLPVTYCVGLVRPVEVQRGDGGSGGGYQYTAVPAPSIDGTYASNSNCGSYYGEDATTGAYVEFTAGADTTMLLRDQPLPVNLYADALPLGDTTAQQAADADDTKAPAAVVTESD